MIHPRIVWGFPESYRKAYRKKTNLYQPKDDEFLLNHNRSGLYMALKSLHLPKGSKVGVMAYNCHTVMSAVAESGCSIVFIDVTKDLRLSLDDLNTKKDELAAVIVSHLFGMANDIIEIRRICLNVPIIEDCAHAFGIKQCGTKGDFAVYSIGPGKFPSVGDGGILKVNNSKFRPAVDRLYLEVMDYTCKQERRLYGKLFVLNWLYKPVVYSLLTLPFLKRSNRRKLLKERVAPKKMARGVSAVYNAILPRTDEMIKLQQFVSKQLIEFFRNKPGIRIINNSPEESNCFMFPVYCDDPAQVKREMYKINVETGTHFRRCLSWCKKYGYQEGDCPNTEYLVHHLLMIPTYKELNL